MCVCGRKETQSSGWCDQINDLQVGSRFIENETQDVGVVQRCAGWVNRFGAARRDGGNVQMNRKENKGKRSRLERGK